MTVKLVMKNPNTGIIKKAPIGFSWTTFLFGPFPALFRGDIKWCLIMFLVGCIIPIIPQMVFAFIYNKNYVKTLLKKGFKGLGAEGDDIENIKRKLFIDLPELKAGD